MPLPVLRPHPGRPQVQALWRVAESPAKRRRVRLQQRVAAAALLLQLPCQEQAAEAPADDDHVIHCHAPRSRQHPRTPPRAPPSSPATKTRFATAAQLKKVDDADESVARRRRVCRSVEKSPDPSLRFRGSGCHAEAKLFRLRRLIRSGCAPMARSSGTAVHSRGDWDGSFGGGGGAGAVVEVWVILLQRQSCLLWSGEAPCRGISSCLFNTVLGQRTCRAWRRFEMEGA
eukprot:scaffold825_cov249-Pinguiococcus_pyrenoidosus.AAC.66